LAPSAGGIEAIITRVPSGSTVRASCTTCRSVLRRYWAREWKTLEGASGEGFWESNGGQVSIDHSSLEIKLGNIGEFGKEIVDIAGQEILLQI